MHFFLSLKNSKGEEKKGKIIDKGSCPIPFIGVQTSIWLKKK